MDRESHIVRKVREYLVSTLNTTIDDEVIDGVVAAVKFCEQGRVSIPLPYTLKEYWLYRDYVIRELERVECTIGYSMALDYPAENDTKAMAAIRKMLNGRSYLEWADNHLSEKEG